MAISIPYDVLFNVILPTLPAKTLGCFKCVSKGLYSFLSSNEFQKMHSRHIDCNHQNHNKFLISTESHPKIPVTLSTFDCEVPDRKLTPTSFIAPKAHKITFLTSFHGLVCLRVIWEPFHGHGTKKDTSSLILWNPVTSDYKKLSKPKSDIDRHNIWGSALGLFYSSCEDDYKLVSVISNFNVLIYSLKSDSWRSIVFQVKSDLNIDRLLQGTCLKENLYFLNGDKNYSVVKFDTKTETFTEMKVTPASDIVQHSNHRSTLMVNKGCLCVCIMYNTIRYSFRITVIELWKINKEGNWKLMVSYQVDSYQMDCCMKPLHLTRNGNLLMRGDTHGYYLNYCNGSCHTSYLYSADLNKKKLNMQKPDKGIGKHKDELLRVANTPISEIVRYTETLVSPNQYIK